MTAPATALARPDLPDFAHYRRYQHAVVGRSERTAHTYACHARLFSDWLTTTHPGVALAEVTRDHVEGYVIGLAGRGIATATRRLAIFSLRAFYDWLLRDLPDAVNPARRVVAANKPRATTTDYSAAELDALLDAPWSLSLDAAASGDRRRWLRARFDHAVLATLRYTGLRLAELTGTRTRQLALDRCRLEVVGKGARQRHVPLPAPYVTAMRRYLVTVRPRCPPSDMLFANPDGYRRGCTTAGAVQDVVAKHARLAGLAGRHHPHRLRHSYATDLLRRGVNLEAIRLALGHANIQTTVRYLHLADDDLASAIDVAFAPKRVA